MAAPDLGNMFRNAILSLFMATQTVSAQDTKNDPYAGMSKEQKTAEEQAFGLYGPKDAKEAADMEAQLKTDIDDTSRSADQRNASERFLKFIQKYYPGVTPTAQVSQTPSAQASDAVQPSARAAVNLPPPSNARSGNINVQGAIDNFTEIAKKPQADLNLAVNDMIRTLMPSQSRSEMPYVASALEKALTLPASGDADAQKNRLEPVLHALKTIYDNADTAYQNDSAKGDALKISIGARVNKLAIDAENSGDKSLAQWMKQNFAAMMLTGEEFPNGQMPSNTPTTAPKGPGL
jgi:hypothetical protein